MEDKTWWERRPSDHLLQNLERYVFWPPATKLLITDNRRVWRNITIVLMMKLQNAKVQGKVVKLRGQRHNKESKVDNSMMPDPDYRSVLNPPLTPFNVVVLLFWLLHLILSCIATCGARAIICPPLLYVQIKLSSFFCMLVLECDVLGVCVC